MKPGEESSQGWGGTQPPPLPCELCGGTGWAGFEDPILGGLVQARCPDCEDIDE